MRAKSQIVKRDDDFLPFQRWHIGHHGACNTSASTYICCPSEWKVRTLGMRRYQSFVHLNSNHVFHPSKVGTAFFLETWRKQLNTASPGKLALHAKEIHLKDGKLCFVQRQPNLQRHILLCKRNGTTDNNWNDRNQNAWSSGYDEKIFDREVAMQPVLDQQKLKALVYYIEVYNYLETISQFF